MTNVKLETEGRVATVTLNRPDIRNAFNAPMINELTAAFTSLHSRADVSVLVLRGEGKSFCSGADLSYMKEMSDFSLDQNVLDARALDQMFWALRSCPQAVVARVHGHAMGGALGLLSCCDVVAAVEGTQFSFSENRIGLVPAVISPYVLEKMNPAAGRRFMLTAEIFTVWQAADGGLIEYAGCETDVDEFITKIVLSLKHNAPESVQVTKQMLRTLATLPSWSEKRELTVDTIAKKRVGKEGQEGLKSFLEKRIPSWKISGLGRHDG